jgi:hypothetical protein
MLYLMYLCHKNVLQLYNYDTKICTYRVPNIYANVEFPNFTPKYHMGKVFRKTELFKNKTLGYFENSYLLVEDIVNKLFPP